MKQDATVTVNWLRFNVPTILAAAAILITVGKLIYTVEAMDADREMRARQIDAKFENIETKIEPIGNLSYRTENLEKGLAAANERTDKLSNTIINSIDLIRRDLNRLTTQVEVLNTRVGMMTGEDEIEAPKQRRSRPGGPYPPDQP